MANIIIDGVQYVTCEATKEAILMQLRRSDWQYLKIPAMVDDCVVTTINMHAFSNAEELESCQIPDSVNYISDFAFYKCPKLKYVAFYKTQNKAINLYFDKLAFAECPNLEAVVQVSPTPIYCKRKAFCDCPNLKGVDGHIKSVGIKAFSGCSSLQHISFADNAYWSSSSFNGCYSLKLISFNGNIGIVKPAALQILKKAKILCKEYSNVMELSYDGFQIKTF